MFFALFFRRPRHQHRRRDPSKNIRIVSLHVKSALWIFQSTKRTKAWYCFLSFTQTGPQHTFILISQHSSQKALAQANTIWHSCNTVCKDFWFHGITIHKSILKPHDSMSGLVGGTRGGQWLERAVQHGPSHCNWTTKLLPCYILHGHFYSKLVNAIRWHVDQLFRSRFIANFIAS